MAPCAGSEVASSIPPGLPGLVFLLGSSFTVKAFLRGVLLTNTKGSVKDKSRNMSNLQRP